MLAHKTTKLLPEFVFPPESSPSILQIQLSVTSMNGGILYSLEMVSQDSKSVGL